MKHVLEVSDSKHFSEELLCIICRSKCACPVSKVGSERADGAFTELPIREERNVDGLDNLSIFNDFILNAKDVCSITLETSDIVTT